MAPDEPLLLWNSGFDPATVRMRLSGAARVQLEMHTAQCLQRHMVRSGVWAEAWAHLRRGEYDQDATTTTTITTIGSSKSNNNNHNNDDVGSNGDGGDGGACGAPASVISTVTALSSVGSLAVGGNSRAPHVALDKRSTEPTYEERRLQLVERGGGTVSVANSYRATVEEFVAREKEAKTTT